MNLKCIACGLVLNDKETAKELEDYSDMGIDFDVLQKNYICIDCEELGD